MLKRLLALEVASLSQHKHGATPLRLGLVLPARKTARKSRDTTRCEGAIISLTRVDSSNNTRGEFHDTPTCHMGCHEIRVIRYDVQGSKCKLLAAMKAVHTHTHTHGQ
jgi:hypothetical protein